MWWWMLATAAWSSGEPGPPDGGLQPGRWMEPVGVLADGEVLVASRPTTDGPFRLLRIVEGAMAEVLGEHIVAAAVGDDGTLAAWTDGEAVAVRRGAVASAGVAPSGLADLQIAGDTVWAVVGAPEPQRIVAIEDDRDLRLDCPPRETDPRRCTPEREVQGWATPRLVFEPDEPPRPSPRRPDVLLTTWPARGTWRIEGPAGTWELPVRSSRSRPVVQGRLVRALGRSWTLDGRELRLPPVHATVALSPDDAVAVFADRGRLLAVDTSTGLPVWPADHVAPVRQLWASPDGARALTVGADRIGVLWEVDRGESVPFTGFADTWGAARPSWVDGPDGWSPVSSWDALTCATVTCVSEASLAGEERPVWDLGVALHPGARVSRVRSEAGLLVRDQASSAAWWLPREGDAFGAPELVRLRTTAPWDLVGDTLLSWQDGGFHREPLEPLVAVAEPEVTEPIVRRARRSKARELVLAVDITGSFRELPSIREELSALVERAAPDLASLVTFYHRYGQVRVGPGPVDEALADAIAALDVACKPPCAPGAATELPDEAGSDPSVGLRAALSVVGQSRSARTVVLVTDGVSAPLGPGKRRWHEDLAEFPYPTILGPHPTSNEAVIAATADLIDEAAAAGIDVWLVSYGPSGARLPCDLVPDDRCLIASTSQELADAIAAVGEALAP